jgi:outer membrane protein OmpA-like peptidoglycan-associated protein
VILAKRARLAGPGEKGIVQHQSQGAEGTDPEVTSIRTSKESVVGGRLLFGMGDATLMPPTISMLDQIAVQVRGHRNIVIVKGHASLDDLPDNASAQQRMDLSLRRAQNVADYLVTKGVSPDILRVQGCSTFEPVAQRAYSATQQTMNRRVEVQASSTLVEELQDPPPKVKNSTSEPSIGTPPAAKNPEKSHSED